MAGSRRSWWGPSPLLLCSWRSSSLTPCATDDPLLDPRVFKLAKLRNGAIGVTAVFFGLFALFFVNAQYLEASDLSDTPAR